MIGHYFLIIVINVLHAFFPAKDMVISLLLSKSSFISSLKWYMYTNCIPSCRGGSA
ncbi:hypothetical protein SCFA_910002 [anaerobic digester metagenome]|uniref:Uncharacterized protein n=1 Tax=anaerobic digester metagenome TaxID=1263854 RepID=A0A485M7P1_9ZZZZ